MKMVHNKIEVGREIQKKIRSMFFRQVEMKDIEKEVGLTERIIRRIITENGWIEVRERYLRYMAYSCYKQQIPLQTIAEKTGVKYCSLCRVRRKFQVAEPRRFNWSGRTKGLEKQIIDDYNNGLTGKEISDRYGYKRKETVYQVLERYGIKRKPSKIYTYYKEDFFEKIDSHEKAYIIGLIMTDGYIIKDYDGFGIQLTEEDGYILEKIRDLIGGTNPITKIDCSEKRKVFKNTKDMCRLHVFSKKISGDLKNLGVVKRKTKILRYNGCVPNQYSSSFFRGLVDGDGSIGADKKGYYWISIASSSKEFLNDIQCNDFKWRINSSKCKNGNFIHVLKVLGGQEQIFKFYKWIYENKNDLYLRRKYAKVQSKIN